MPKPLVQRARELRRQQTPAEVTLWNLLRENKVAGFGFRRQHPIDRFIADFACPAARLVIELDDSSHHDRLEQDGVRDAHLKSLGWTTLRFQNSELLSNSHGMWEEIQRWLVTKEPLGSHHQPHDTYS